MPASPDSWFVQGDRVYLLERPEVTGTVEGPPQGGLITVKHDHGGRAVYRDEQLGWWTRPEAA